MLKQKTLYTLLWVALSIFVASPAMAQTCLAYSSSGTCVFYSGSISCDNINGTDAGNVMTDPKYFDCIVSTPAQQSEMSGVVFCADHNGTVAPGIQGFLDAKLHGMATINPDQVDSDGIAAGLNVHAKASSMQLATLNRFCQNPAAHAVDFVPSAMTITVQMQDASGNVVGDDSKSFDCTLPNPGTLVWDPKAGKPERRQYNCTPQ